MEWTRIVCLVSIALLLSLQSGCRIIWTTGVSASLDAPEGVTQIELPAEFIDGWIIVQTHIEGKGPYRFVFDTGADGSTITEAVMDEVGLRPIHSTSVRDAAGIKAKYPTAISENVSIGPLRFHGMKFLLIDRFFEREDFHDVVGIIGHPGFEHFTLDIDYPNKKLRIHATPIDRAEIGVTPLRRVQAGIPEILISRDAPNGTRESRWFKVDSGGEFMLQTTPSLSRAWTHTDVALPISHGISLTGAYTSSYRAPIDGTLIVGDTRLHHAIATINSKGSLIGHELLRHFRVRLDAASGLAALVPADGRNELVAPQYSGIGINSQANLDDGLLVISIEFPSPATDAGLRPGDIIVAVDGVPVSTPGPHRRMWRVDPPPITTLTVDRNDHLFDLAIPTQRAFPENLELLRQALRSPNAELTLPGVRLIYEQNNVRLLIESEHQTTVPDTQTPP